MLTPPSQPTLRVRSASSSLLKTAAGAFVNLSGPGHARRRRDSAAIITKTSIVLASSYRPLPNWSWPRPRRKTSRRVFGQPSLYLAWTWTWTNQISHTPAPSPTSYLRRPARLRLFTHQRTPWRISVICTYISTNHIQPNHLGIPFWCQHGNIASRSQ